MIVRDFKHNIVVVNLLSNKCLKRSCYVPQIAFRGENIKYVCGRRELHGCPIKYIMEENKIKE